MPVRLLPALCAGAAAEANRRLRRELGASAWELRLPGGGVLRSGGILQRSGELLRREDIERAGEGANAPSGVLNAGEGGNAHNGYGEALGCDPKMFTYSQPVRVLGAWREGKLQRLIWLRG